jgi:hypothetical protein
MVILEKYMEVERLIESRMNPPEFKKLETN